jgi:hypothetical protein
MTNKTGKQTHRKARKMANRKTTELNEALALIRRLEQERADLAEELIKTEIKIIETENASLLARAEIFANAGYGPTAPE